MVDHVHASFTLSSEFVSFYEIARFSSVNYNQHEDRAQEVRLPQGDLWSISRQP